MIHSNAPWSPTGYGTQTKQLAAHLQSDGHDVAVSCFYGLSGTTLSWEGITLYPAGFDAYGNDVLPLHAANFMDGDPRAGLVITLVDAWVLNPDVLRQTNTACWVPVDHEPVPPRVLEVLAQSGCWPIAMSRFGERMLRDAGLEPFYAPHGIDTGIFKPLDRDAIRKEMNLDGRFVVGMVAANKGYPSRKCWSQAIEAFAEFAQAHDDAVLYLHTEPNGTIGHPISAQLAAAGIDPGRVRVTDPYVQIVGGTADHVARLHNAFDVLLNPSMGEGFGIPIVEAQACGTPVIVTDCTAMSELCGAGWKLQGDRVFTDQRSYMTVPRAVSIVAALEDAHARAHTLRAAAREFAMQYDADRVYQEHWRPILAELEQRIAPLPLPDPTDPVELEAVLA